MLTFGRALFPRPPNRQHVPNDDLLQKLNDLIFFGVLGLLLLFVGLSFLFRDMIMGAVLAVALSVVHGLSIFSQAKSP